MKYNKDQSFNSTKEQSLNIRNKLREASLTTRFYKVNSLLAELIPENQAILHAVIVSLSSEKSFCWATSKTLGEMLGKKPSVIDDRLKSLEEKGLLLRNTIHLGPDRGCKREIILYENALKYWKLKMCSPTMNIKFKLKFIEFFHPISFPTNLGPPPKNRDCYHPRKIGTGMNPGKSGLINRTPNRKENRNSNRCLNMGDAAVLFEREEEELRKTDLPSSDITRFMSYIRSNPEKLLKAKNRVGFSVTAIRKDYVKSWQDQDSLKPPDRDQIIESNKLMAQEMLGLYGDIDPELGEVKAIDVGVKFVYTYKERKEFTHHIVSYTEDAFEKELIKYYQIIKPSRQHAVYN